MHPSRYHVLVADGTEATLNQSVGLLKRRGYTAAGAASPDEAGWWLSAWPVDVLVAAPRFGGSTGVELFLEARGRQPDIAGLITGPEADARLAAEGERHGLHIPPAPVEPGAVPARVADVLAAVTRRQRWPRKEITTPMPMRLGEAAGTLMDVSYGGLKFELADEPYVLQSPIELDFPRADLRVRADVVWSARRANGRSCVFGASLTPDPQPAQEWRAFVDRI